MNQSTLPYWLALMIAFVGGYGAWKWYQLESAQSQEGIVITHLPPLEDFELVERSGKPFRSRDMRGKVWVATFFFSTCPGSCPRLNASIRHMTSLPEIHDVTWVSITVDPDVDTLPVLQEYAQRYEADPDRWLFCRGDLGYVNRIGTDFLKVGGVSYRGHRDYATIIDKSGKIRGMFDATSRSQSERMVLLLKECLAESAVEAEPESIRRPGVKTGSPAPES